MFPPGQSESWQHSWQMVGLEAQYLPMICTVFVPAVYLQAHRQTHTAVSRALHGTSTCLRHARPFRPATHVRMQRGLA